MSHWTEELFVDCADYYAADLEANVDEADEEVADLLDLLADEHDLAPESALDVACGIGRHAIPMAEFGLDVDGVDLSETFLERARTRATESDVAERVGFVVGDMRDLPTEDLRDEYDLVTCFFTSFGYFDDETNREVLAEMADRVRPGGALVLEVANKVAILGDFSRTSVFDHADQLVTEQREYRPEVSRLETTRHTFEETEDGYEFAAEGSLSIRLYTPVELGKLFADVGLDPHFYGDTDGTALSREYKRQFVVGLA